MIRRAATSDPTASSTAIASQLPPEIAPSARTVRRRLQLDFHLRAYRAARKPKLSAKNIKDRLVFAKRYRNWSAAEWSRVLFSDESSILQFSNRVPWVRRPCGERFSPRYTAPTVKHATSIMVWGAISAAGTGPLWLIPQGRTVNAGVYLEILQDNLPRAMQQHNCAIFQHDGAPAHSAKSVGTWLAQHAFEVLRPWPGSSPDLNPIEHCWSLLKSEVAKLQPTSRADLATKIQHVWTTSISADFCRNLIWSMPRRIEAVIASKGGPTRF
jgi:transposase